MAGVQRDYLAEEEVGEELGLASAPLTSSYLPFRSMTLFMYLIVKHRDLSVVTGQWGNTPGDCSGSAPHYLLPWLQVQSTWPNIFWEKEDEEVHNSVRYGQLIAHLIKKRVIKIGCLMDDSVRINNTLLVRCSDLLQS